MADNDKRVSQFDELTSVADGDLLGIVDVSDTTQSGAGSTKKITKANLLDGTITADSTDTLTNKTIDADDNTIQDLTVSNLKAGVLDTDLSTTSASDNTIPSAKATKAYVDAHGGGAVDSVNGQTGTVVLDQDDINNGTTYVQTENNFTDALKTKLDNTNEDAEVATVVAGDDIDVDATDPENPIVSLEDDIDVDTVSYQTDYTPTGSESIGTRFWNSTKGTTTLRTSDHSSLDDGQEVRYYVKANGAISNGDVVQFAGWQGDHYTAKVADTTEVAANPMLLMGIATEDIANGEFGNIAEFGEVTMNTTGWSADDLLWWDNSTGQLTNVEPEAPDRRVLIAVVVQEETSPAAANGILLVRLSWAYKLGELEDVNGTTPEDRAILSYDETNGYWDADNDFRDYLDASKSAGWLTGGAFSDNGDGSITVGAGTGLFRTSTTMSDNLVYASWDEDTDVSLANNENNYIYVDYNSGSPTIGSSTTNQSNGQTIFNLGLVFREDTDVHMARAGQVAVDPIRMIQARFNAKGLIELVSGGVVAETGARYLTVTGAILYGGLTRFTTDAIDTSGTDTFEYYYTDGLGGWQYLSETATQINNTQYDNGGTLTALTSNRYRTDWVYLSHDGDLLVILGNNNDTLVDAQAKTPPTSLPPHAGGFSTLIAKVIAQEGETNLAEVDNLETVAFSSSGTVVHNETTGKQGGTTGEYYHLTSAEHTVVGNTSGVNTGDQDISGIATNASDIDNIEAKTDYITVTQAVDLDTMESDIAINNAKVTNATHTGEVTGSEALTIADNVVDEANLKLDESPTNGYVLTADSTKSGGMKWAEAATGTGDVVGPASSTDGDLAQFDGTTGKLLKGGLAVTTTLGSPGVNTNIPTEQAVRAAISAGGGGDVSGPASSVDDRIATFDGTTGKLIQDGGKTIAETLARANHTGTQTASTISDFDTEVSNNTDVAANTSARHDAATVSDTNSIDMSITGQEISGSVKVDDSTIETDAVNGVQVKDSGITNAKLAGSITIDKIETTDKSGFDDTLITGTAGTNGNVPKWNADGDIVDSGVSSSNVFDKSVDDMDDINNGTTYVKTANNFTDTLKTKLDGVEEAADVTDGANVGDAIEASSSKTTPVDADTLPILDSAVSNVLKKITWANIKSAIKSYYDSVSSTLTNKTLTSPVINTSISGTAVLDEDNMASDSATKLATQQSIKAYADAVAPADGWIEAGETWTYFDSYIFYISGVNLTDKYNQPGLKIKLTNSTIKYFEVVSATYTSGNTYVSLYGFGTYALVSGAISSNYTSMVEKPQNFPTVIPNIQVYSSTGLTNVADSTATLIPFNTEVFDDTNDFNTSTNTFTAPLDGDYQIIVQAASSGISVDDKFETSIYVNGSKTIAAILEANASSSYFHLQNISNIRLDAGDTIKAYVAYYGTTGNCDLRSESNLTFMRIYLTNRVYS